MRILYIDIDSLRPDHLGCYGYARPTSPIIDSLAKRGVRLNRCFASDSPCVPSRAAVLSGRPGIRNGVIAHENTPAGCSFRYGAAQRHGNCPTMAHHLSDAGYLTATCTSFHDRHFASWWTFGFREVILTSLKGGNEDAPEVNQHALPWLQRNATRADWFLHVNYWDAHTLYTEPMHYLEEMAHHPAPGWPDAATIQRQQNDVGIRTAATLWGDNPHDAFGRSRVPTMPDAIGSREDFEHLINGYDGGIHYADEHIGHLIGELDRQGVLEETVIIVSADHGEAFGEMGQYMEHGSASTATQQIPMIVVWPGVTDSAAGSGSDHLTLNTDLAVTLADGLGLDVPDGWSGQSFLRALRGQPPAKRDHVVWSHGLHTRQRAVFDGRMLFIRTYHPSWYAYPPRMLFDLETDPHHQHDLAPQRPAEVQRMEQLLLDWERDQVRATGLPDAMRLAQSQPPAAMGFMPYLARLEREGRADAADRLRKQLNAVPTHYAPAEAHPQRAARPDSTRGSQ